MLLTLISTYIQNLIWILLVHNIFLAANVCKYTVRYAVRLPSSNTLGRCMLLNQKLSVINGSWYG